MMSCALESSGAQLELPAYVMPGQAAGLRRRRRWATAARAGGPRGQRGRRRTPTRCASRERGRACRAGAAARSGPGASTLAGLTQDHHAIDARGLRGARQRRIGALVREGDAGRVQEQPRLRPARWSSTRRSISLWTEPQYEGHRWGMAIDLNSCIGCSACVVACQAENNIPVVGKRAGGAGPRDALDPHRPLLHRRRRQSPRCVHPAADLPAVRDAPCEQVCPVAATVHTAGRPERHGLQPLRRHALLHQQLPLQGAALQLLQLPQAHAGDARSWRCNPEVTVRSRGVMEKCTYCVQRIQAAKIAAKNDRRRDRRRRDRPGLRPDLPDAGDRLRRPERPGQPRAPAARPRPRLRHAGGAERQAAHGLPGQAAQPRTGNWRRATWPRREPEPATAGHAAPQAVPEVGQ